MNPLKIITGFLPFLAFSLLSGFIGAGWAGLAGTVLAVVVIAATSRDGIKIVPAAQAAVLLALAVVGFTGGPGVDHDLVKYGPAIAAMLLGLFMVATAATMPFTAQYARAEVPRQVWHSRQFLEVNRHISTAWGLAVLLLGLCHLAGAEIGLEGGHLAVRLAVSWVVPLVALWQATAYSKRAAEAAKHEAQERMAS